MANKNTLSLTKTNSYLRGLEKHLMLGPVHTCNGSSQRGSPQTCWGLAENWMENKILRHLNGDLYSESYVSALLSASGAAIHLEMEKQDAGKAEMGLITAGAGPPCWLLWYRCGNSGNMVTSVGWWDHKQKWNCPMMILPRPIGGEGKGRWLKDKKQKHLLKAFGVLYNISLLVVEA